MSSGCNLRGVKPTLGDAEKIGIAFQEKLGAKSLSEMRAMAADRIWPHSRNRNWAYRCRAYGSTGRSSMAASCRNRPPMRWPPAFRQGADGRLL
jgi:hypothetical protein